MLVLISMSWCVASICARKDASWMAAAATLELKVICVAASGKAGLLLLRFQ